MRLLSLSVRSERNGPDIDGGLHVKDRKEAGMAKLNYATRCFTARDRTSNLEALSRAAHWTT